MERRLLLLCAALWACVAVGDANPAAPNNVTKTGRDGKRKLKLYFTLLIADVYSITVFSLSVLSLFQVVTFPVRTCMIYELH